MNYSEMTKQALIDELNMRDETNAVISSTLNALDVLELLDYSRKHLITPESNSNNNFHQVLNNCLKITGSEYGFIGELFRPEGKPFYFNARSITDIAWNEESKKTYQKIVRGEISFSTEKSLYGKTISSGKPFISNDPANDPHRAGTPHGHPELKCFLGIPLHAGKECVGLIGLANRPGGYDASMVERLQPLTKIASIMMQSVKIEYERRNAYNALKSVNEQLESKSEELEQFAYIASHDLKEPLNGVIGLSGLLEAKATNLDDDLKHYIERIQHTASRMRTLIDDLLAYSRSTSGSHQLRPVDLNAILLSVKDVLNNQIDEKGAELQWHNLPTIQGIFPQMEQLFQNIIDNALKYQRPNIPPIIRISSITDKDNHKILIFIQDNGIGIIEEYIEQVFLPFKRLHARSEYEGSGIGLSICKKIMLAHGGDITLESTPNEGSTFKLIFPMPKPETQSLS